MDIVTQVDEAIKQLSQIKSLIRKEQIGSAVLGSEPSHYPSQFQHSDWDCDDSPTKFCMYTNYDYDSCIFCGQPDERK